MAMLDTGYHDVPAGKIASIVTFLEMTALPPPRAAIEQPDLVLEEIAAPDPAAYLDLHRRIGTDWLWFSRLAMTPGELAVILGDPAVDVFFLKRGAETIGLLELDRRRAGEVELAFFGLVPEVVGAGIGRWLMDQALKKAFDGAPTRVWVHTCTLDHPAALAFYMRSGFRPCRYAVEVAEDPRLTGVLPRHAAPQVPAIG